MAVSQSAWGLWLAPTATKLTAATLTSAGVTWGILDTVVGTETGAVDGLTGAAGATVVLGTVPPKPRVVVVAGAVVVVDTGSKPWVTGATVWVLVAWWLRWE